MTEIFNFEFSKSDIHSCLKFTGHDFLHRAAEMSLVKLHLNIKIINNRNNSCFLSPRLFFAERGKGLIVS